MPDEKKFTTINILEPSVGVGNFLPTLIEKYGEVQDVNIDVVDIDKNSISILKALLKKLSVPENVHIHFIVADSLQYNFKKKYDIVIGNPPFMKLTKDKNLGSITNRVGKQVPACLL